MHNFRYYFLYGLFWILTLPPLKFLYFISDIFYFIVYYLIAYRKAVVFGNLKNAFPDKNDSEITKIAKKYYQHICDSLIEALKSINLSYNKIQKRYNFKNLEIFDELFNQEKDMVLLLGHYGNWEWMNTFPPNVKYTVLAIYQPLQNKTFDRIMNYLRGKFGVIPVPMNDVYKCLLNYKNKNQRVLTYFLADHRPHKSTHFWTNFLNQEASFHLGAEKIAKKLDQAVVLMIANKVKRGYYEINFEILCENAKITDEFEITSSFVSKMEEIIKRKPEYWTWSHKRWKYKRKI